MFHACYNDGVYLIVSTNEDGYFRYSTDGVNFSSKYCDITWSFSSVAYGNKIAAFGNNENGICYTSDFSKYNAKNYSDVGSVVFGFGKFIFNLGYTYYYTIDFNTITKMTSLSTSYNIGFCVNNLLFAFDYGVAHAGIKFIYSTDGLAFTEVNATPSNLSSTAASHFEYACYADGKVALCAYASNDIVAVSEGEISFSENLEYIN